MKKPSLIAEINLDAEWLRYVIQDERGRYWTGRGWSRRPRRALLYAHADFLREDIEELKAKYGP